MTRASTLLVSAKLACAAVALAAGTASAKELSGVAAIAAGSGFTCALTEAGSVKCWGAIGSAGPLLVPFDVPLSNISTRGQVLAGNDVMIGGFIIQGSTPQQVLITARGPSLAGFGITNPLANPKLEIFAGQTKIHENDNWETNANKDAILAFGTFPNGLAPSSLLEAALLVTLQPGAYTAIVSGSDGGTGVGIVEVFAP